MFIDTQERPEGEVQQKVGRLKLSEAIRIGARIRPKCTTRYFDGGGSCAMGAILEASGFPYRESYETPYAAIEMFPELFVNYGTFTPLANAIYKLNDSGESRESIADWLESKGL